MQTAWISHDDMQLHDMGPGHPESPARLRVIRERLQDCGLLKELQALQAMPASHDALQRVHPESRVHALAELAPDQGLAYVDGDTALCPQSWPAALLAAGAVVQAVNGIGEGSFKRAFCAVRPPGHHAETDLPMGFCLFNNIAVGVRHAQQRWGLERIAIVDFDVHHGNGTVEIFRDSPEVLVCSSFQHPFYPHRFWDIDRPNIINSPLKSATDGTAFRRVAERDWLPALEAQRPEIIFVSAGFDAHRDDPLAGLNWREADYRWVTDMIVDVAGRYSQGRVVSVLEGGYDLNALAASVEAHVSGLVE